MAQYLTDVGQRRSLAEQLGGQRMPQPVRAHSNASCSLACTADHVADRARVQAPQGREAGQEDLAGLGVRPPVAQVGGQGLAHLAQQRQTVLAAALAPDAQLAGPPLDVIQLQAGDLA